MSATRKMTDKGEGKIGKMKTQEKRLEFFHLDIFKYKYICAT